VVQALGFPAHESDYLKALASWSLLPEWEDAVPPAPETQTGISVQETRRRLSDILAHTRHAEPRPEQADYASAIAQAFSPQGATVLAEAGTGVGKTLGYLAPATLWAERSEGAVWLSTYTRNLQRQIESEARRVYGTDSARQVVIRKGARELSVPAQL
jgi:ATP-dependent DNA helicase DinG